jgi:Uma2 family endonuclease
MGIAPQQRRWTRQEYDHMVESGILGPEDRVELVGGEILTMSPRKGPHATAVQLAGDALRAAFGQGFVVRSRLPLALSADSEPEPDVAVVSGNPRDFRDAHPPTALQIVEVADTSLAYDRSDKKALYAEVGIPEYWIVNLLHRRLEAYREPAGGDYAVRHDFRAEESISPLTRPDATVQVAELLP